MLLESGLAAIRYLVACSGMIEAGVTPIALCFPEEMLEAIGLTHGARRVPLGMLLLGPVIGMRQLVASLSKLVTAPENAGLNPSINTSGAERQVTDSALKWISF